VTGKTNLSASSSQVRAQAAGQPFSRLGSQTSRPTKTSRPPTLRCALNLHQSIVSTHPHIHTQIKDCWVSEAST
jgi:hypothetical protein